MGGIFIKSYLMGINESFQDASEYLIEGDITENTGMKTGIVKMEDAKLSLGKVYVLICVEGDTAGKLKKVDFDNIKIVKGEKPVFTEFIDDQTIPKGSSTVISGIKFKDVDGNNVKMYLIGAPGFVSVTNFQYTKSEAGTEGSGDISISNASCSGNNTYDMKVVIDDGFLVDIKSFSLSVTGCN